ncbi:MAG: hypothetical protein HC836_47495 [Richelia sp. RM2_1_2]|nr:hypothetical protein [Richelia sp. RM2_1_2]
MDYINYFVMDLTEMIENGTIHINVKDKLMSIDERGMYILCNTYRMDTDEILYFMQKITKYGVTLDG